MNIVNETNRSIFIRIDQDDMDEAMMMLLNKYRPKFGDNKLYKISLPKLGASDIIKSEYDDDKNGEK